MKQIYRNFFAGKSGEQIDLGLVFLLFVWCLIMSFALTAKEEVTVQKENPGEVVHMVSKADY